MASLGKEIFKYELLYKIIERNLTVGIIGLGYVGLPLALSFCNQKTSRKIRGFYFIFSVIKYFISMPVIIIFKKLKFLQKIYSS